MCASVSSKMGGGQGSTLTRNLSYVLCKALIRFGFHSAAYCSPNDETSLISFPNRMGRYSAGAQLVIARIQALTFSVAQSATPGSQVNVQIKMDTSSIAVETTGLTVASSAGVWYVGFPQSVLSYISWRGLQAQLSVGFSFLRFVILCRELWVLWLITGHMFFQKTLVFYYLKHHVRQKGHLQHRFGLSQFTIDTFQPLQINKIPHMIESFQSLDGDLQFLQSEIFHFLGHYH